MRHGSVNRQSEGVQSGARVSNSGQMHASRELCHCATAAEDDIALFVLLTLFKFIWVGEDRRQNGVSTPP